VAETLPGDGDDPNLSASGESRTLRRVEAIRRVDDPLAVYRPPETPTDEAGPGHRPGPTHEDTRARSGWGWGRLRGPLQDLLDALPLPSREPGEPGGPDGETGDAKGDALSASPEEPAIGTPIHLGEDATVGGDIHEPDRTLVLDERATVEGDVRVHHLVLRREARVQGRIQAERVDVGEGARTGPLESSRGVRAGAETAPL
jgi:hypothetical protein